MKLEVCCTEMLDEWNAGNITLHEDGSIEWMDMGDGIKYCPFCGEKFDVELTIKNKVEE